ncbi:MAG TPA: phosphoribosyltransferase [Devosia sp.]
MWASGRALFEDRRDAGQQLAGVLKGLALSDPIILALPRGGVPVAHEVAMALHAPLDLMLVRKLGAPGHSEYGIGAITDGANPRTVFNEDAVAFLRPSPAYIEAETKRQLEELERRRRAYLGGRPPPDLAGRTVVLVDDGIATGGTVKAALMGLRDMDVKRLVLAVPVAPASAIVEMRQLADDVVCLATPEPFLAVGQHYRDFSQTTDEEVVSLLRSATGYPEDREVRAED